MAGCPSRSLISHARPCPLPAWPGHQLCAHPRVLPPWSLGAGSCSEHPPLWLSPAGLAGTGQSLFEELPRLLGPGATSGTGTGSTVPAAPREGTRIFAKGPPEPVPPVVPTTSHIPSRILAFGGDPECRVGARAAGASPGAQPETATRGGPGSTWTPSCTRLWGPCHREHPRDPVWWDRRNMKPEWPSEAVVELWHRDRPLTPRRRRGAPRGLGSPCGDGDASRLCGKHPDRGQSRRETKRSRDWGSRSPFPTLPGFAHRGEPHGCHGWGQRPARPRHGHHGDPIEPHCNGEGTSVGTGLPWGPPGTAGRGLQPAQGHP